MLRSVFARSFADQRRALVGWCIGIAAYAAMILAVYPSIHAKAADFDKLLQHYPAAFKALFNVSDFTSPGGYLSAELLSFIAPLLLVLYAVSHASGATAGEEETGTIDILLSTPVTRRQVVIAKFASVGTAVVVLGIVLFTTITAVSPLVDLHIGYAHLAAAISGLVGFALLAAGIALVFGCLTGRRGLARGLAAVVTLAAYLLSAMAPLASWLKPWRPLSPYFHAIGRDPLQHGLTAGFAVLLVSVVGLLVLATWVFERRDLSA